MSEAASLIGRSASVEAPATIANLGAGYDCLGLAVELPVTEPVTAVPAPLTPEDRLAAAKVPAKVKRAQRRAAAR